MSLVAVTLKDSDPIEDIIWKWGLQDTPTDPDTQNKLRVVSLY